MKSSQMSPAVYSRSKIACVLAAAECERQSGSHACDFVETDSIENPEKSLGRLFAHWTFLKEYRAVQTNAAMATVRGVRLAAQEAAQAAIQTVVIGLRLHLGLVLTRALSASANPFAENGIHQSDVEALDLPFFSALRLLRFDVCGLYSDNLGRWSAAQGASQSLLPGPRRAAVADAAVAAGHERVRPRLGPADRACW